MENNKMIIPGVIVALIVLVAGVFLLTGGDDEDTSTDTPTETSQVAEQQPEQTVEAQSTIVELAQATDSLSILVDAVVEAELVETLSSEGPFTVFAPTNDAFATLLEDLDATAEELLARDDLGEILTYHVVSGEVLSSALSDGQVITTVQGGELTVSIDESGVMLTDANGGTAMIVTADIDASNGVVHVIDSVVLP